MSVRVEIDWYRHALSCANVMHERGFGGGARQIRIPDPDLTLRGYRQARKTSECINDRPYDMICCSRMCRAIETAVGLFGRRGKPIYVLPYISEKRRIFNIDKQNEPQEEAEARAQVTKFLHWTNTFYPDKDHIDLRWITNRRWPQSYGTPNPELFYGKVLESIVSHFIKKRISEKKSTKNFRIRLAIVSHGRFIRETLNIRRCLANLKCKNSVMKAVNNRENDKVCKRSCCHVPELTPKYTNANTSCWRETREFDGCGSESGVCTTQKRTRIDLIYSPEDVDEFSHQLEWRDVINCPKSVKDLFDDRRF